MAVGTVERRRIKKLTIQHDKLQLQHSDTSSQLQHSDTSSQLQEATAWWSSTPATSAT